MLHCGLLFAIASTAFGIHFNTRLDGYGLKSLTHRLIASSRRTNDATVAFIRPFSPFCRDTQTGDYNSHVSTQQADSGTLRRFQKLNAYMVDSPEFEVPLQRYRNIGMYVYSMLLPEHDPYKITRKRLNQKIFSFYFTRFK